MKYTNYKATWTIISTGVRGLTSSSKASLEDKAFSSYEETKKVLSNFIGSNIDGSVSETIVRAHSSNGSPNQNGHPQYFCEICQG